jgi:hypothetical protein
MFEPACWLGTVPTAVSLLSVNVCTIALYRRWLLVLSIYLFLCLSIYPSIYLSVCRFPYLSIYLSIYFLFVYPSIYLSICLSTYLSLCLSICLSTYLSIYIYIYISVYLWLYSPCRSWPLFSFLICTQSVGLLGRGISPSKASTYTQNNTNTDIHVLSGIQTHDRSVGTCEDGSCPRPRGHCDRHVTLSYLR